MNGPRQLEYSSIPRNENGDAIAGTFADKLLARGSLGAPLSVGNAGQDRVHFTSAEFYAREEEGRATLDVIRIGTLTERSTVTYRTEDRSGVAGERFVATRGTVVFEPGDALKTCEVEVIQRSTFDTTLEFAVILGDPERCVLETRLGTARVSIIDDDRFPTNELAEKILDKNGCVHAEGRGVSLLLAWMSFAFTHVPTIWWKSVLTVVLDQVHNAYYMLQIFLRVYLVDHVLNLQSDPEMLLLPGRRFASACAVAAIWTAPNLVVTIIDYAQVGPIDMGFTLRKYLRVNFVRTYLSYTEHSLQMVPLHDLVETSASTIPQIVESGYCVVFDMLRSVGKIFCVGLFVLLKDPSCALPLFVFPATMLAFACWNQDIQLKLAEMSSEQKEVSEDLLVRASLSLTIIKGYMMRASIVDSFQEQLSKQREVTITMNIFHFWMEQLVPWVSLLSIGAYIVYGSYVVLEGQISVGVFLATMNAYSDLGNRFQFLNSKVHEALGTVEPLMELTKYMNLETDFEGRLAVNRQRRGFVKDALSRCGASDRSLGPQPNKDFLDSLRIHFQGEHVKHPPCLRSLQVKVKQDTITLVSGPHGCGKATLLKMFSKNLTEGDVYFSPFLFCLEVSRTPDVITYVSLFENLCYGSEQNLDYPDRVRRIFKWVLVGRSSDVEDHWLLRTLEDDIEKHQAAAGDRDAELEAEMELYLEDTSGTEMISDNEAQQRHWHKMISDNEKWRIHLARALIFNPNIMVLHKPCDDVDTETVFMIMQLLREFVQERGLECDEFSSLALRHPRTVFLSCAKGAHKACMEEWVDYHWFFDEGALRFDSGGYHLSRFNKRARENRMLL